AHLLGEHGHRGWQQDVKFRAADPADQRVRRHSGRREISMTGWLARTSPAGPQYGRSAPHRSRTAVAGPRMEEQRRPISRARPANAATASGVAATGTMLAPT